MPVTGRASVSAFRVYMELLVELMHQEIAFSVFAGDTQLT